MGRHVNAIKRKYLGTRDHLPFHMLSWDTFFFSFGLWCFSEMIEFPHWTARNWGCKFGTHLANIDKQIRQTLRNKRDREPRFGTFSSPCQVRGHARCKVANPRCEGSGHSWQSRWPPRQLAAANSGAGRAFSACSSLQERWRPVLGS